MKRLIIFLILSSNAHANTSIDGVEWARIPTFTDMNEFLNDVCPDDKETNVIEIGAVDEDGLYKIVRWTCEAIK